MIFFIDEDHLAFAGWLAELELRGHEIVTYENATEAFGDLSRRPARTVDAVIIDVMLASGADVATFPYDSMVVGLRLLRVLCDLNGAVFPSRAIIMTNSISEPLRLAIRLGEQLNVPVWDKRSMTSPVHFADMVETFMASRHASR